MYDQATGKYTDEAIVESFVGKTVFITHTVAGFQMGITGTLVDLNGKGYYQVSVGDVLTTTPAPSAKISFNKGTVQSAWTASSGNIIRLEA